MPGIESETIDVAGEQARNRLRHLGRSHFTRDFIYFYLIKLDNFI